MYKAHSLSALDANSKSSLIACETLTCPVETLLRSIPGGAVTRPRPASLASPASRHNTIPSVTTRVLIPDSRMAWREHLNRTYHTTTSADHMMGGGWSANQFTTLRSGVC